MKLDFRMHAERTPNPDSIKWVLSEQVAGDVTNVNFSQAPAAATSPLAAALFLAEGVAGVFLGSNFVTVTREEGREWTELAPPVVEAIKAWVKSEEPALGAAWEPPERGDEGEVVKQIRSILERDIAPYVESDGGQVVFAGFAEGIVQVHLEGACAGCPSSTITLKMGIEARLKEEIPEVESVVAV